MKYTKLATVSLVFFSVVLTGCQSGQAPRPAKPLYISSSTDNAHIAAAAEQVLRDIHFTIEKSDPEAGYLKTNPLTGGEFFELWRKDNRDARSLAYSSLHSTQRIVEITIEPEDDKTKISCDVQVQRLALPTEQISGYTDLPGSISKSGPSRQRLQLQKKLEKEMSWEDAGKDEKLAAYIIGKIENKLQEISK